MQQIYVCFILFIYLTLNGEKKHQGFVGNLHQQPTWPTLITKLID